MSDMTSSLIEVYLIVLLSLAVLSLVIYWEIIERKTEDPYKPSTVKDVKREQHAGDLPKPRGDSEAMQWRSTSKRRGRLRWTPVHPSRRPQNPIRPASPSVHRRHDRTNRRQLQDYSK